MHITASAVSPRTVGDGITGGYTGNSLAIRVLIATFTSLAWYNVLELNTYIFLTFKNHRSLYFWSLLVSSWGIVLYGLGFLFKLFQIVPNHYVNVFLITIGWWSMVTGQSVVLYSRLHLIVMNRTLLRRVLWMIIIDAVILHAPTTVLTFGSNATSSRTTSFVNGYNVVEKIQMTGFCIQEFIISGIYLWESAKFLNSHGHQQPRVLLELFVINVIIIIMDLSLLGLEYANLYILEIIIKGFVYSVKLKLEFAILGKLVQYIHPRSPDFAAGTTVDIPGLYLVSHSIRDKVTSHSKPQPIFKGQETDDPRRGSDVPSEYNEGKTTSRLKTTELRLSREPSDYSNQSTSLNELSHQASRSDEDLEETMKQYSVGSSHYM